MTSASVTRRIGRPSLPGGWLRAGLLGGLLGVLAAASPALGQTLSQRMDAVRARHRMEQRAERDPKVRLLQALVFTKVTVDFDATAAKEVFGFLKTVLGVNLIVRSSDDPVGHGIDLDTPITLELEAVPAVEVLELVLEQCSVVESCTWQVRRGFIEVGTKERLSAPAARELRAYPIDEMLYQAPRFENSIPMGMGYGYPGWVTTYESYATRGVGGGYGGWYGGYGGYGNVGGFGVRSGGFGASMQPSARGAELNSEAKKKDRALSLVDVIVDTIEPGAWEENGGTWATIRYREGTLFVNAPDFIQRQLGGYPPVPPPRKPRPGPGKGAGERAP